MFLARLLVLSVVFWAVAGAPAQLYEHHTLVRIVVPTLQLSELESEITGFDAWEDMYTDGSRSLRRVDVLLDSQGISVLERFGVDYEILMQEGEIQKEINMEHERLVTKRITMEPGHYDPVEYFTDFRTLQEIYEFCDSYLVTTYPNLLTPYSIGPTYEGRIIRGYRLTTNPNVVRPAIYLDAQVHAREWLATPTLLYTMNNLLEDFANGNPEIIQLLSEIEIHFTPLVNQDGFEYTWSTDRLWRKNRRFNGGTSYGVDLNRNWGPASTWCTSGSSNNTNSNTYCGAFPFSESEIESTRRYIDDAGIFRAGIDFHTTGPLILWPWQWTRAAVHEPNYSRLKNLGDQMQDAMNRVYNFGYRSIQGVDLYPHSGGFIDYNFEVNDMVTYTVEGRGPNFIIAPSQIVPSGIENYEGVKEMLRHVLEEAKSA